jgi:hypothetical protein
MFISENAVNAAADDLIQEFEIGSLHSRSSVREILPHAIEVMAEHEMPFRRSLAIVIAKRAQAAWAEIVHAMK